MISDLLNNNSILGFFCFVLLVFLHAINIDIWHFFKTSPCSSLKLYLHSCIHLFDKYVLIPYYTCGFVPATEDLLVNKA